jgi:DNA-binding transcriptional LysR family regulator
MMKRIDVDLNLLPIVVALYEERSVSRAAERLGVSQPTLSGSLAKLRESFNDALFIRSGGAMEPTERTLALLQPIRDMLALVHRDILTSSDFSPERLADTVTVALSDVGEMVFLPRLMEALRAQAPHADLQSVNLPHSVLEDALEAGSVDLAVGYFPDLTSANVFQQRLLSHHFVCLIRAGHTFAAGSRLTEAQFLAMEHAVVRAPGRSQEIFEQFLRQQRIRRKVVLTTPNFLSIPSIVARCDLLATVPHAMGVAFGKAEYGLKAIDTPFDPPRIMLRQHWHRKFHKAARTIWLRELVAKLFNDASDEYRRNAGQA